MRFVTTRAVQKLVSAGASRDRDGLPSNGVSLRTAMLEGLAPDGGLYVPESIDLWNPGEISRLRNRTLTEIAYRVLRPYTRPELDATTFEAVVVAALNFPIPLVEVEPHFPRWSCFTVRRLRSTTWGRDDGATDGLAR
jgi:hypothetical protein